MNNMDEIDVVKRKIAECEFDIAEAKQRGDNVLFASLTSLLAALTNKEIQLMKDLAAASAGKKNFKTFFSCSNFPILCQS